MFSLAKFRVLCVFVFSLSVSGLTQAAYTDLYSFGDSLSDTGNVFVATGGSTPAYPYFDGNFSNGPVWADLLGPMLGLSSPTASLTGGTNYAFGGARTTVNNAVPSTQSQVATYLTDTGGAADPNALYTIWTGGNDINAVSGGAPISDIESGGLAVASIANDLLIAGAQNILVINVPNLGLAPISDGNEAGAEYLSGLFNTFLVTGLDALGSSDVTLFDSFALLDAFVADPAGYGLTNVDDNCLDTTGGLGSACDDYLFWDGLHPTAAGHQLIADAVFAAVVPVPAAVWLFGSGLIGLTGLARRKTRAQ